MIEALTKPKLDLATIYVKPYKTGVALYESSNKHTDEISLETCFSLPYNVYVLNKRGETLLINKNGIEICGFESLEQAKGRTIISVSNCIQTSKLLDNCDTVLYQENFKLFDEHLVKKNGETVYFVSFKFPCYDSCGSLIGILGFSIVVGMHIISDAITAIHNLGLMPKNRLYFHGINLTHREIECLQLTVNGYSAKAIAKQLKLSPRTVEEYLKNIKFKFDVSTKQQLIQKVCRPSV